MRAGEKARPGKKGRRATPRRSRRGKRDASPGEKKSRAQWEKEKERNASTRRKKKKSSKTLPPKKKNNGGRYPDRPEKNPASASSEKDKSRGESSHRGIRQLHSEKKESRPVQKSDTERT